MLDEHNRRREATRIQVPVSVTLEWASETGEPVSEDTVTENISRLGAAVYSTLPLEKGNYLRVSSTSYAISTLASVRNRTLTPDGRPRLHLQFLHEEWPLGIV